MKISEGLPEVVSKTIPAVPDSTPTSSVISLLISKKMNAIPLSRSGKHPTEYDAGSESERRCLAITGYSIISRLTDGEEQDYARFLAEPCVNSALSVGTISVEKDDLLSLLHVYEASTFGFAFDFGAEERERVKAVSLRDLLVLYDRAILSSKLIVKDVSSFPTFSTSRGSQLRSVLSEMKRRKLRRVMIAGTQKIASDRQILEHLFSKERIRSIEDNPERLLNGTIEELEPREVPWVDARSEHIGDAARLLEPGKDNDCLLTDYGIVTPWDLIIKPWRLGALTINN